MRTTNRSRNANPMGRFHRLPVNAATNEAPRTTVDPVAVELSARAAYVALEKLAAEIGW